MLRTGWGTADENAAWFVNGNWYRDHAHSDLGEVVLFAHNAPLSLDFGNFYSPYAPGGILHSVVLPFSEVADTWTASPPPLDKGGRWQKAQQQDYQGGDRGGWSRTHFERGKIGWTRAVSLAAPAPEVAVFGLQDSFDGEEAGVPKVMCLNLMATGPVQTPDGPRAGGQAFGLKPGLGVLGFTGQTFAKHPAQGIDWEMYVLADRAVEGFLAEWSHQNVCPEQQTLLRLKSDGPFRMVIVAWPKGARPADLQVQEQGGGLAVTAAGKTVRIAADGAGAAIVAEGPPNGGDNHAHGAYRTDRGRARAAGGGTHPGRA